MTHGIDLVLLAEALRALKAGLSVEQGNCNQYLLNLMKTMRESGVVLLGRIDFACFELEEMREIFQCNTETERKISALTRFNGVLCKAEPACATTRTFC